MVRHREVGGGGGNVLYDTSWENIVLYGASSERIVLRGSWPLGITLHDELAAQRTDDQTCTVTGVILFKSLESNPFSPSPFVYHILIYIYLKKKLKKMVYCS